MTGQGQKVLGATFLASLLLLLSLGLSGMRNARLQGEGDAHFRATYGLAPETAPATFLVKQFATRMSREHVHEKLAEYGMVRFTDCALLRNEPGVCLEVGKVRIGRYSTVEILFRYGEEGKLVRAG